MTEGIHSFVYIFSSYHIDDRGIAHFLIAITNTRPDRKFGDLANYMLNQQS
jgi:hypothetical protein